MPTRSITVPVLWYSVIDGLSTITVAKYRTQIMCCGHNNKNDHNNSQCTPWQLPRESAVNKQCACVWVFYSPSYVISLLSLCIQEKRKRERENDRLKWNQTKSIKRGQLSPVIACDFRMWNVIIISRALRSPSQFYFEQFDASSHFVCDARSK